MTGRLLHTNGDIEFVEQKLARLEQLQSEKEDIDHEEEWFKVHQQVFSEAIERLPASGVVLAQIKGEYERVVDSLQRSLRDAEAHSHQMHVKSTEVDTIRNYHHRRKELKVKLESIKADSKRIESEIDRLRKEQAAAATRRARILQQRRHQSPRVGSSKRRALGLSIKEATDLTHLQKELQRAKLRVQEEREATQHKYVPAQRKTNLQIQLKRKEELGKRISAQNQTLGILRKRLTVAVEEAGAYRAMVRRQQLDPSQTDLADYIVGRVGERATEMEDLSDKELEDPTKEREAEMVLDCLERFNELFEGGRYQEAALVAATSPKGVLRTPETLQKFKRLQLGGAGGGAPLLSYCEALMQSAGAYRAVPLPEALECAQCVLEHGEPSQLTHWIVQESLPASTELGTLIFQHCKCGNRCTCGCKALAYAVFKKCGAKQQAALCLAHQGRFTAFLAAAQKARFTIEDYESMLYTFPALEFAQCLVSPPKPYSHYVTVFEAMHLMLTANAPRDAVALLEWYLTEQHLSCTEAVMGDTRTSWDVWQSLLACLQKAELNDLAEEILALMTVRVALSHAVERVQRDLAEMVTQSTQSGSSQGASALSIAGADSDYRPSTGTSPSGSGYSSSSEDWGQSEEEDST